MRHLLRIALAATVFCCNRIVIADVRAPEIPNTPAGHALSGLLHALNSNDEKTINAFVSKSYAPFWFEDGSKPERFGSAHLRRMKSNGGKLILRRILSDQPHSI